MKRSIIELFSLLGLLAAFASAAGPLTVDEDTVLLAAMRYTPDFDFEAQARTVLTADAARWAELDEEARATAIEALAADLRKQVSTLGPQSSWRMGKPVVVSRFDAESRTLFLPPTIREREVLGWMRPRDTAQLPEGFNLLVLNADFARQLRLGDDVPDEVLERLAGTRRLHVELDLRLLALQQRAYFKTTIQAVRLRFGGPEEAPFATIDNPRTPAETAATSLLREGFSLDLASNHHLDLAGGRLLDPLVTNAPGRECGEFGRLDGHLVVRCGMNLRIEGVTSQVEQFFVGGRLVESSFTALAVPNERVLKRFERYLANILARPGVATTWKSERGWTGRYDPSRWENPEELSAAPLLVVSVEHQGFRFDRSRLQATGEQAE